MTLKTLFSKEERERLKEEKAAAKAAAELEARKVTLRNNSEIKDFIIWYNSQVNGKKDKDINFVQLGYDAYSRYWHLVQKFPDVAKFGSNIDINITADDRLYSFLDDEGCWHNWKKGKMETHYKYFIAQEEELHLYGDYSLSKTGPLGGGIGLPYYACAYLSYAYYEKSFWSKTIKLLQTLIE